VRLAEELETPGQFRVLLVAVNDSPDQAAKFLGSAAGRALHDPSWEIAHRYSTRQLPETHLLVQTKVVKTWVGATAWDDPAVRQEPGLDGSPLEHCGRVIALSLSEALESCRQGSFHDAKTEIGLRRLAEELA
jgi:hypothetical protein